MARRLDLNLAAELLTWPVARLSAMFPSNSRTLIFGARSGYDFSDCSAVIFAQMAKRGWNCIWLSRDHQIVRSVRKQGLKAHLIGTPAASWHLNRASAIVISSQLADVSIHPLLVRSDARFVFTGHGKSAKLTYLQARYHQAKASRSWRFVRDRTILALASSALKRDQIAASYGLNPNVLEVTGMPRNDQLVRLAGPRPDRIRTRILYAPTWRKQGVMAPTQLFGYPDFDPAILAAMLEKHDLELILRPHGQDADRPEMQKQISELESLSPRISGSLKRDGGISEALTQSDLLITDYSSIDDDFLVLDRPIIYAPYDYDQFERLQGFGEPYASSRAGPVAASFAELCELIVAAAQGNATADEQRTMRRSEVYEQLDGQATSRAIAKIEAKLAALSGVQHTVDPR